MHFERQDVFQNAKKLSFFFRKKNNLKKYVCLPYLKLSDPLPETHLLFLFGLTHVQTYNK